MVEPRRPGERRRVAPPRFSALDRWDGRRLLAAQRGPAGLVLRLALDVDVASLAPGQDGVALVVEHEVALVGADHQDVYKRQS